MFETAAVALPPPAAARVAATGEHGGGVASRSGRRAALPAGSGPGANVGASGVTGATGASGDGTPDRAAKTRSGPAPPRARLSYSFSDHRAIVEILNPLTGDVIMRFPPERAERALRAFTAGDSGVFLNKNA